MPVEVVVVVVVIVDKCFVVGSQVGEHSFWYHLVVTVTTTVINQLVECSPLSVDSCNLMAMLEYLDALKQLPTTKVIVVTTVIVIADTLTISIHQLKAYSLVAIANTVVITASTMEGHIDLTSISTTVIAVNLNLLFGILASITVIITIVTSIAIVDLSAITIEGQLTIVRAIEQQLQLDQAYPAQRLLKGLLQL